MVVDLVDGDPKVVPAANVVIAVEAPDALPILLDGRLAPFRRVGGERLLGLDLTRSTGFHRIQVGAATEFWFGTEDAKLGLSGIEQMLKWLRDECRSWTGQLLFSNGEALLDPYVAYGWLDQHADAGLGAAQSVVDAPRRGARTVRRVTDRGGGRIDVKASLSLLRRRQMELLVPAAEGIPLAGDYFLPRKVVERTRVPSLNTQANRRVAWLVALIARLAEFVGTAGPSAPERDRSSVWSQRARLMLSQSFLAQLTPSLAVYSPPASPSTEELTDRRYAAVLERSRTAGALGSWLPTVAARPVHAYVQYADEVYQAFVATVVAEALDLERVANSFGAAQPVYRGKSLDLYSDAVPPGRVMRSWRSYTPAPDDYRPDLLLHDVSLGAVLLGDAKYRQGPNGPAESGRKDMHAYMAAFGVANAVMFYPPVAGKPLTLDVVSAQGQTLFEVALAPHPDLNDFMSTRVVPAVIAAMTTPPWRD
jgi:hypothetical protein